jgi:hypothetical protein
VSVGRNCLVCFSSDRQAIEDACTAGISFRVIANEYARGSISESSVQRHWRNHTTAQIRIATGIEYLSEPSDLLERILEIADSARNTRRSAEMSGNAASVTKASDTELKALTLVGDRLGVRDGELLGNYRLLMAIVTAIHPVISAHPAVGREMLQHIPDDAIEARGFVEETMRSAQEKKSELSS